MICKLVLELEALEVDNGDQLRRNSFQIQCRSSSARLVLYKSQSEMARVLMAPNAPESNQLMGLNTHKAGMQKVDKQKVDQVI